MPSPPTSENGGCGRRNVRSQSPARRTRDQSPARGRVRSLSPSRRTRSQSPGPRRHQSPGSKVRSQSPARRARSKSPAPQGQTMRDQSPSRGRVRSQSPARRARGRSPAPQNIRDQSPAGSSKVRSRSPARSKLQDSFSSVQSSSLMGLDLESTPDDLSLGYSVDETKSSRPSTTSSATSSASGRDDLSLSYSVDDSKSRASTYISAVSDESSSRASRSTRSSRKKFTTNPIPEDKPSAQEGDQPSLLGQFLSSPLEYVFGGNDDDVSTLGEFNDYNSWDGDNSTIATTTTLKKELSMQHQPTIYEGDEEEEEEGEDEDQFQERQEKDDDYTKDYSEEEQENESFYGEVSEASESQEDGDIYQEQFSETSQSREAHESSQTGRSGQREPQNDQVDESEYTYVNDDMSVTDQTFAGDISAITEDPYFRQRTQEANRVARMEKLDDVEEMEEEQYDESNASQDMHYESEDQHFDGRHSAKSFGSVYSEDASSIYSGASPNFLTEKSRFSVTDEDAARNRSYEAYDDDRSISLSAAMESESVGELIKRDPHDSERSMSTSSKQASHWSSSENNSSIRSESWQRDIHSNRTWRSAKIQNSQRSSRNFGSSFRRPFLSSQSVGQSVGSYRTTMTAMPEVPEVIREGDNGHPTMTRGMSGRAVIHVKMDHTSDGTIEELSYTAPLVDCNQSDSATYISYGDENDSSIRSAIPFYDDYFRRYKIVRIFTGKRCHRVVALMVLVISIALAVLVSLVAQVNELDNTLPSSTSLAAPVSLDDLKHPASFPSVHFSNYVKAHIHDWFDKNGDYKKRSNDVPYYVDIPKSGPEIVSRSWGGCLGLTIARDQGREVDSSLNTEKIQGIEYVVIDLSTKHGVEHAANLNIISSGLPDVIISPLFHDVVGSLYSSRHKARFMISMREPVERSLAMYNHLKTVDASVAKMTIEQFAQSDKINNNYVTRLLSDKIEGTLTQKDVEYCKELLRRKAVVGTYEDIEVTLKHFEEYLGWLSYDSNALNCQANIISNDINKEGSMVLDESSSAYALLRQQNMHDLALYGYVRNVLVPYQHEVIKRQQQAQAGSIYTTKQ